jgi:hypothetical protein
MVTKTEAQEQVDKNFEAFKKLLPELLKTHRGKYALLRNGALIQVFDSPRDARLYAEAQFKDGLWSLQEVTDRVVDLGYFSHAMPVSTISASNRAHH